MQQVAREASLISARKCKNWLARERNNGLANATGGSECVKAREACVSALSYMYSSHNMGICSSYSVVCAYVIHIL